jgi:hypothetical protein
MLRHSALGASGTHAVLPLLGSIAAMLFVFSGLPQPIATDSGSNGAVFTRIEQALISPGDWVYDNVLNQVEGGQSAARNGNTGQISMSVTLFIFLSAVTLLMWRHTRRDNASPRRIGRRI